jgi:hypothetical protein
MKPPVPVQGGPTSTDQFDFPGDPLSRYFLSPHVYGPTPLEMDMGQEIRGSPGGSLLETV